ncbi:MAG: hypothetical protein K0B06_11490 [Brevefilum sp.]|nr:hypothetical protein [Brevefilum sp.]
MRDLVQPVWGAGVPRGTSLRGAGIPGLTGDDVAILGQHGQQASALRWFEIWVLAKRGR